MELTFENIEANAKKFYESCLISFREKISSDKSYADEVAGAVVNTMIDEMIDEVVVDVHRAIKLGYSDMVFSRIYDQTIDESLLPFHKKRKKQEIINCPQCNRRMHPCRFTQHLEDKCQSYQEKGRSSARLANLKISKECYAFESDEDEEIRIEKSVKKAEGKKKKPISRRQKINKTDVSKIEREMGNAISKNIKEIFQSPNKALKDSFTIKGSEEQESDIWISPNKIPIVNDGKLHVFSSRCGVRSAHTGKFCGRSLRCPLHSDAERAVARKMFGGDSRDVNIEDVDCTKSVAGSFSELELVPTTPISKKPEKPKAGVRRY